MKKRGIHKHTDLEEEIKTLKKENTLMEYRLEALENEVSLIIGFLTPTQKRKIKEAKEEEEELEETEEKKGLLDKLKTEIDKIRYI